MRKKIVITGGTGRFGAILKKYKKNNLIFFPDKNELDILNYKKITSYLGKKKPNMIIEVTQTCFDVISVRLTMRKYYV